MNGIKREAQFLPVIASHLRTALFRNILNSVIKFTGMWAINCLTVVGLRIAFELLKYLLFEDIFGIEVRIFKSFFGGLLKAN